MLSNRVREIMTTRLTSAPVSRTVQEVLEKMIAADVGRIIITDNDSPVGIFTEKHVLERVANNRLDPRKTIVQDVMAAPVHMVGEQTPIVEALGEMLRERIRHLQVCGTGGQVIGLVSMRRILKIAVELGQRLSETKTVGSIMSQGALSVDERASVHDSIELMIEKNSSAVVITSKSRPSGIFTERDVLTRVVTREIDCLRTPIGEVMTTPLIIMPSTALIGEVLAEMYRRDIRNMPVSDQTGNLIGLVSMPDVLEYARAFDIDEEVRKTWREVKNFYDSPEQFTPG